MLNANLLPFLLLQLHKLPTARLEEENEEAQVGCCCCVRHNCMQCLFLGKATTVYPPLSCSLGSMQAVSNSLTMT